jgi:hypothetical protein
LAGALQRKRDPQPPQFCGLRVVSTQLAPHFSKPGSQLKSQTESAQLALPCAGLGQAVSQPPQWAGEVATSRHAPAQLLSAASQLSAHFPFEHTCAEAHAALQPPQ